MLILEVIKVRYSRHKHYHGKKNLNNLDEIIDVVKKLEIQKKDVRGIYSKMQKHWRNIP